MSITQQCFRTDAYREAARLLGYPTPDQDHESEGSHTEPYWFNDQIKLGSDLMVSPKRCKKIAITRSKVISWCSLTEERPIIVPTSPAAPLPLP